VCQFGSPYEVGLELEPKAGKFGATEAMGAAARAAGAEALVSAEAELALHEALEAVEGSRAARTAGPLRGGTGRGRRRIESRRGL